jgi:hypothetical protein
VAIRRSRRGISGLWVAVCGIAIGLIIPALVIVENLVATFR